MHDAHAPFDGRHRPAVKVVDLLDGLRRLLATIHVLNATAVPA